MNDGMSNINSIGCYNIYVHKQVSFLNNISSSNLNINTTIHQKNKRRLYKHGVFGFMFF